jgi:hypothetical protein
MNKRDALKLKPEDWIAFGDACDSAKVSFYRRGQVLFVTDKGGIRVKESSGFERWVPYHFVHQGMNADTDWFGSRRTLPG